MRPICLVFLLCLGGCLAAPDAPPVVQADVLKPGDALRIIVAGEEELSGGFMVNSDGNVRMAMLGTVPAAGLSPPAFQDKLRQLLAAGYVKAPQIQVERLAMAAAPPLRPSQ